METEAPMKMKNQSIILLIIANSPVEADSREGTENHKGAPAPENARYMYV